MNYKGYELFYVNGSSHTAGGGLEEPSVFVDQTKLQAYYLKSSIMPLYKEKYNVSWENRNQVTYAARLSEMIGIPVVNEATNGGGPHRVVRMTYQFIEKNWEQRHKMFVLLEKPEHGFRAELYFSKIREYCVINLNVNEKTKKYELGYATPSYLNTNDIVNQSQDLFQHYLDNHHDLIEHGKNAERAFIGLYSFCKLNKIPIKLMNNIGDDMLDNSMYQGIVSSQDIINFDYKTNPYSNCHVHAWCDRNKMLIKDELGNQSGDFHPGYFGHLEYAKKLKIWLDENLDSLSI